MTIDFYYTPGSAPCRAVLLAAKAVGVKLNLKEINLMKGEHLTPEYKKINPQHTVPALVDDGLLLSESRAIITYLVSQYGKDDSLYPKDPKKRAVVDQRLYFDASTLYARYADLYYPLYFAGVPLDSLKADKLRDAYQVLNNFLANSKYAAGDHLTVADISLLASISTAEISGFNILDYENVAKWYDTVKATVPGYDEDAKNREGFKQMVEHLTK
ncbi:hypothetical protein WA026_005550 [Henosepilachna vigintioctopunctata]|uniref:Uncharacterized protein n=1 Tax=Henosepilachna vigintioctopunctata TaxID=420089 RepID=A0AAW1TT84_9CUCU